MKLKKLHILLLFLTINFWSYSSHVSGGDITYQCLGGNNYRITLALYRDCLGITLGTTANVRFSNTCGLQNPANLNLDQIPNPNGGALITEISQVCNPLLDSTTCNGGDFPGMQLIYYSGVVTLSGPCDSWEVYHTSGARNTTVNLVGQPSYYYGATINSASAPCNNGPVFTGHQTPYVCVGQPVNYNYGVIEADGDSLVYTLISALTTSSTNTVPYAAGYTGAVPIPGIILDPNTGQLTFTPTLVGGFVVAVRITEYDPVTGAVKGTVMRDIQFVVENCPNQIVDASTISISNYSGGGGPTDSKQIEVCEGDSFCFDMIVTDPNATDNLTITSNVTTVLSGATMNTIGTNPTTVSICWTVPPGANSLNVVTFQVRDDACPITGQAIFSISVKVISSTVASPNDTICNGEEAQLSVTGGSSFTWRAIYGDSIIIGTNFSCNPCSNPIATPKQTTAYEVTSNLGGGCNNVDTVIVFNDHPSILFSSDTTNGCYPILVNFTNNTDPLKTASVSWDFNNGITSSSNTPQVPYDSPGFYDVNIRVTSPNGCIEDSTAASYIEAYDMPVANFVASPQPTNVSNTLITFQNLSSSDIAFSSWFFGISDPSYNNTSNIHSPSNKYPDIYGDNYEVTLAVESSYGCKDTIVKEIVIHNLYSLYVPSSFTPNADGFNDTFKPSGEQIDPDNYEFRIYNRWGNLVFFTIDVNQGWDGTNSEGEVVEQGVYSWTLLTVDANNGDEHNYKGHVMIIK